MSRVQLTGTERQIMVILLESGHYLTTTQVSKRARVSWNTADKYLDRLHRRGWINRAKRGNRVLWKAISPY